MTDPTGPAGVIEGTHDPAFQPVHDAFAEGFVSEEVGASCAVTVGGELVVDLWGGHRDLARRRPWEQDTIVNVWSSTKTVAALCVLMLHDRGSLSIDRTVATYWPEFAANGKGDVLVRHVLAHTAGLPVFDDVPDDLTVFDWDECCRRLAGQAPRWTPGDGSGYHAETQGWLLGEIVRRVDGRTLGTFFREEVAEPLDLDLHIGLPDAHLAPGRRRQHPGRRAQRARGPRGAGAGPCLLMAQRPAGEHVGLAPGRVPGLQRSRQRQVPGPGPGPARQRRSPRRCATALAADHRSDLRRPGRWHRPRSESPRPASASATGSSATPPPWA